MLTETLNPATEYLSECYTQGVSLTMKKAFRLNSTPPSPELLPKRCSSVPAPAVGETGDSFTFVSWEERQNGGVICETIHRSKGLERDAVVVVTEDKGLSRHLLYVGLSRAVSHLVVVAPQELLDRMV